MVWSRSIIQDGLHITHTGHCHFFAGTWSIQWLQNYPPAHCNLQPTKIRGRVVLLLGYLPVYYRASEHGIRNPSVG